MYVNINEKKPHVQTQSYLRRHIGGGVSSVLLKVTRGGSLKGSTVKHQFERSGNYVWRKRWTYQNTRGLTVYLYFRGSTKSDRRN